MKCLFNAFDSIQNRLNLGKFKFWMFCILMFYKVNCCSSSLFLTKYMYGSYCLAIMSFLSYETFPFSWNSPFSKSPCFQQLSPHSLLGW